VQDTTTHVRTEEPFQCTRDCQLDDGTWSAAARSSRACGLPGLPPAPRTPTVAGLLDPPRSNPYMGRYASKPLDALVQLGLRNKPGKPREDIEDGCPGAWYRTAYVDSVDRYTRARTKGGGRVHSPPFNDAPWQVQSAVLYLESEQERCIRFVDGIAADRLEAAMKRDERKRAQGQPARRRR
jgi:hypothetical protein